MGVYPQMPSEDVPSSEHLGVTPMCSHIFDMYRPWYHVQELLQDVPSCKLLAWYHALSTIVGAKVLQATPCTDWWWGVGGINIESNKLLSCCSHLLLTSNPLQAGSQHVCNTLSATSCTHVLAHVVLTLTTLIDVCRWYWEMFHLSITWHINGVAHTCALEMYTHWCCVQHISVCKHTDVLAQHQVWAKHSVIPHDALNGLVGASTY